MRKKALKCLALMLAFAMMFSMAVYGAVDPDLAAWMEKPLNAPVVPNPLVSNTDATETSAADPETPVVYAYSSFNEKFSPFFGQTSYDNDVAGMTQISTMTLDRAGDIVYNAIEGETRTFNGKDYFYQGPANLYTYYDEDTDTGIYRIRLRDDLVFSDGVPVTADDLIFSIYANADPDYDGLGTMMTSPIKGIRAYMTQMKDDAYDTYAPVVADLQAAGKDHEWTSDDNWSKEIQDDYWAYFLPKWKAGVQAIVDYIDTNYISAGALEEGDFGTYTPEEAAANENFKVAFGMLFWGFGSMSEDNVFTSAVSGTEWNIADGEYPTIDDYFEEAYAAYGGSYGAFWDVEDPDGVGGSLVETNYHSTVMQQLAAAAGEDVSAIPNIEGVKKIDQYTVEIQTAGFDAPSAYSALWYTVSPLHYYGDVEQYDYENNKFGFPYGDLSLLREKTTQPMGAGAYKFVNYENGVVYFEANDLYWEGAPLTKNLQFKESNPTEVVAGTVSGSVDTGELSYSITAEQEVNGYNSNGTMVGDVLEARSVMFRGYGYIGLYAPSVCVDGDPGSEASKNLRKALATVLSVHRDVAINSYYGAGASIINYPLSSTNWASPQPADEGYQVAYSTALDGSPLYTSDMDTAQKVEAAKKAALEYFEAAGFTVSGGKVTGVPGDGVRKTAYYGDQSYLEYEIYIAGYGTGSHPSFAVLTDAQATLAEIGITLLINDPATSDLLFDAKEAGTLDGWCAAWQEGSPDPHTGVNQTYHSTARAAGGQTNYNDYGVSSELIDENIDLGRQSDDQTYRKALYKEIFEEVMDWAVEIPVYQRRLYDIYSVKRINMSTLNPAADATPFIGSIDSLQLEMQ